MLRTCLLVVTALIVAGCDGQPAASGGTRPTVTAPVGRSGAGAIPWLTGLRMVTPSIGWALAGRADGSGLSHPVRTTDAGAHWNAIALPPDLLSPNLVATDFHDADHAWIAVVRGAESTASRESAVVVSTRDGGAHWSVTPRFDVDGMAMHIQFIDPTHGWVFAGPSAGGAIGSQDTTLYRTVDAGQHWQVSKPSSQVRGNTAIAGRLPEACPMGGPVGPPTFTNGSTGWLGGFCDHPFFYVTHDGGLTWAAQNLPGFPGPTSGGTSPSYAFDSFQAITDTDFAVYGHRGFTTGGNALQEAAIYVTHDAGASWTAYRLPYAELAAEFVDPIHGWMIGAGSGGDIERRSLYSTPDGGRSWRLVDGPAGYYAHDLNFVDTTTGFLAVPATPDSAPELLRTTDGGATWGGVPAVIN